MKMNRLSRHTGCWAARLAVRSEEARFAGTSTRAAQGLRRVRQRQVGRFRVREREFELQSEDGGCRAAGLARLVQVAAVPPESDTKPAGAHFTTPPGERGATAALLPFMATIFPPVAASRLDPLLYHLLPKDFLHSVRPSYFTYSRWHAVSSLFGTTAMILSTQSMLYAVGLGVGAIPAAAAVNWVLKDGIGQFGGVLFASLVNSRFDADPKRWRLLSTLALNVSCVLEALTPLVPVLFLPLASMANFGKNVSWLAASASRASMHLSFARRGNIADITAKAGSQSTLMSSLGTMLGVALSPIVGSEPVVILPVVCALSILNFATTVRAIRDVDLTTINPQVRPRNQPLINRG